MGYAWMSELCDSSLNSAFNMSTLLTKTNSDEVNLSSTMSHERFTCMLLMLALHVQWGEQVFETLQICLVFLLTKHVEVCNLCHRYTSTVRDGI